LQKNSGKRVPEGMRVQLARLFGSEAPEAKSENRTDAQWRRTLLSVLRELDRYLAANVETDDVHLLMLHSGLYAAHESLKQKDFWPGYAEGITRLALLLMGDYPDHRRRKGGRKREYHYRLSRMRTVQYTQTTVQRVTLLLAAPLVGIQLTTPPRDALSKFRAQFGYKPGLQKFFEWYRHNYPQDYAAIF
jgi:hypothetical protein